MYDGLTIPTDLGRKSTGWRRGPRRPPRPPSSLPLLALGAAGLVAAVIGVSLRRVEVVGESMAPALAPGDHLVVVRRRPSWLRPGPLRVGDVVAVPDPRRPSRLLVKRVGGVGRAGVVLRGDNAPASTDSRSFGPVDPATVWGVARYRYAPEGRTGVMPRGRARLTPAVAAPARLTRRR